MAGAWMGSGTHLLGVGVGVGVGRGPEGNRAGPSQGKESSSRSASKGSSGPKACSVRSTVGLS